MRIIQCSEGGAYSRMKHVKISLISLFILFSLLSGVLPSFGEKPPSSLVIESIPSITQIKDYCGPASLAMVLKYWGFTADQKAIGKVVFDPSVSGTNGAEMILYARKKGLSAYSWNSNLSDLKEKLAAKIPIIVLQDCNLTDTSGHYRVAIGYDDKAGVVYVRDSYEPNNKSIPYATFEKLWKRHGNWSLLICPNNKDSFKKELDDMNPIVHIDLAYAYYKHGDLIAAERESRIALALDPENYNAKSLLANATSAAGTQQKDKKQTTEKPSKQVQSRK